MGWEFQLMIKENMQWLSFFYLPHFMLQGSLHTA